MPLKGHPALVAPPRSPAPTATQISIGIFYYRTNRPVKSILSAEIENCSKGTARKARPSGHAGEILPPRASGMAGQSCPGVPLLNPVWSLSSY